MRSIDDVFNELKEHSAISIKEKFCQRLNEYLQLRYQCADENDCRILLTKEYTAFLLEVEEFRNSNVTSNQENIKSSAAHKIRKLLSPFASIKRGRETIIEIAFILSDKDTKEGEDIANDLLKLMHYPRLHSTSAIEICYIYSLRNGLSYLDALALIHDYQLSMIQGCMPECRKASVGRPKKRDADSTISVPMGVFATEATSSFYYDRQKNIGDKKILLDYLTSNSLKWGVGSKKISRTIEDTFYKMMKNYKTKKDLVLDFFLYYSSEKSLSVFLQDFKDAGYTTAETARIEYDRYIKARPREYDFYPMIHGSYSTVYDNLNDVLKGRGSLTREGFLLWLVFYYCPGEDKEYFLLDDINEFIGSRFLRLDEQYGFDKYILTVLSFSLEGDTVMYNGELIHDGQNLCKDNIHSLRKSIIQHISKNKIFNSHFSVEDFGGTNDSTTSITFETNKKRLRL